MASNSGYIRTNNEELRIMLVGRTGTGKTASINTILGRQRSVLRNFVHYRNEMFQEAERKNIEEKKRILGEQLCILEEQDCILREKEKQIQKEREELERKLEEHYEEEMKIFNAQLRVEREERERKAV